MMTLPHIDCKPKKKGNLLFILCKNLMTDCFKPEQAAKAYERGHTLCFD
jgi:hypothetical protein